MKKSTLKQLLIVLTFFTVAATLSSCNKGYGCPTNFKVAKAAQVVQNVIELAK